MYLWPQSIRGGTPGAYQHLNMHPAHFCACRFPISNFLAATGYIITLLADQVVQVISESQANTEKSKQENSMKGTAVSGNGSLPVSRQLELVDVEHASKPNTREGLLSAPTRREASGCDDDNDDRAAKLPLLSNGGPGSGLGASASGAGGGDEDCHNAGVKAFFGRKPLSFATAVLLACALCIHSILEGMALGAQSSMRSTEDIMIAIAAHKGLAAYALGASIVESKASAQRYWTVIGLFSMATPVGIFLGYILSEASKSRGGAAMSALASGTFLYVALMEVIPKELADGQHRLMKMSMFLLGYSLMSLLAVWA